MKHLFLLSFYFSLLLVASCNNKPATVTATLPTDTLYSNNNSLQATHNEEDDYNPESEYSTMYFVLIDTGKNYYALSSLMHTVSNKTGLPIDTLNRHYNNDRNMIVLADDDEDEMWRGEYYPRRYGEDFMSIEYWQYFLLNHNQPTDTTFALVAGMFYNPISADSLADVIKKYQPSVFVEEAKVFNGCMH